jgi:FMN phosphatase YigB (HAD superfamily)
MTLIFDIDDTLIKSEMYFFEYVNFQPIQDEIDALNEKYNEGHTIILFTGRHWNHYKITKEQLKKCGIKYHELIMSKPVGYYIDATMNFKSCREIK